MDLFFFTALISELKVYCPNQELGCQATIILDNLSFHLKANCKFSPTYCVWKDVGCDFKGLESTLSTHLETCAFEKIGPFIKCTTLKINDLERTVKQQSMLLDEFMYSYRFNNHSRLNSSDLSSMLSSSSTSDLVEQWPNGKLECRRTFTEHKTGVTSLTYYNGVLYSGSYDGSTKVSTNIMHSHSQKNRSLMHLLAS